MIRVPSILSLVAVAATAACASQDGTPQTAPARPSESPAAASERDPVRWAALLARLDAAPVATLAGVRERDQLAALVDRAAGQRYASVSRLYWHPDLGAAIAAARTSGKPILSLRMLGRLDEDLSCANSRFFRIALYGNRELSGYLAQHFELTWSSERPVPVARVDFGDGRVLERTIAGNSAHYVLDRRGRPVDVLPGLMTPAMFRAALERAEPEARAVSEMEDAAQVERVREFHVARAGEAARAWAAIGSISVSAASNSAVSLIAAERRAMSKAMVERPMVEVLTLGPGLPLGEQRLADRSDIAWTLLASAMPASRLDDQSRRLLASLSPTDWARAGQALPESGIAELTSAFEQIMARDSSFNEYYLHNLIDRWFVDGVAPADLAALNAKVYADLFLTPAADPWLGMATPGVFTALPSDGVVLGKR